MEPCHSLSMCHDEVQSYIYSFCEIRELGVLSLVSKKISLLVNSDSLWQALCLRNDPTVMQIENTPWKDVYRDEVDYLKYIGNTRVTGTYKLHPENDLSRSKINIRLFDFYSFSIHIRTDLSMSLLHLKKIVRKENNLEFSLTEIDLYFGNKKIEESDPIKDLVSERMLKMREQQLPRRYGRVTTFNLVETVFKDQQ